jgi:hypothetical protein
MHFLFTPWTPHTPPLSLSVLDLITLEIFVKGTNYDGPHYADFSSFLSGLLCLLDANSTHYPQLSLLNTLNSNFSLTLIFMVIQIQVVVFWIMTPCSVMVGYQHFGGPSCFHLLGYDAV